MASAGGTLRRAPGCGARSGGAGRELVRAQRARDGLALGGHHGVASSPTCGRSAGLASSARGAPLRPSSDLPHRRTPPALLDGAFSLLAAEGPRRRSAAAERLARRSGGRPGSARSGAADGPHDVRSGSGRPTRAAAAAAARRACTPSFLPLWCPSLVAMAAAGDGGHGGTQRPGHGGGQAAGRACGRGGLRTAASRGGTAPPRRPSSHRQRTARAQGPCKASWRASAAACARPRRTAASGGVRASARGHGERRRPRRLGRRGGRTAAARASQGRPPWCRARWPPWCRGRCRGG